MLLGPKVELSKNKNIWKRKNKAHQESHYVWVCYQKSPQTALIWWFVGSEVKDVD